MKPQVVCYCFHISHVLNLGRIPELLAKAGWQVRWLNAFPAESFPLNRVEGIEYHFGVPLEAVGGQSADLYLSPFVGQAAHFPQGALRVHFLVSLTSLEGVYDEAMFDHYDVIACAGKHHIDEFSELGQRRGWHNKILLPLGYPKLDGQRLQLSESHLQPPDDCPTVIFAPTHAYYINRGFSVLRVHGEQIAAAILDEGMRFVFRPHMESWRDQDRPVVEQIVSRFEGNPRFVLDRSGNYFERYAQTNMMITDISGTGFTYAFTFGRPALYFAPNQAEEKGKRGIQFQHRDNIGLVARQLDELVPKLRLISRHQDFLKKQIAEFRDWLLFNPTTSEQYFADAAPLLIQRKSADGWHRI
ncbi:CDP-glycerol glycerophosphotransferase family protein [Chitiniphilus eburneus]|uniref:CDP-glycerol--poly(Glycerophosphate) glycerophosphotransferase n=1 Tax=Chitiniphilus eburneus TaxID=2571148 RepID=A0A4U0Q205_9NEIS|nr:CDP-glycerol glycerophosphotransferase family protein [Chitiniphilus eburneus]TJZ74042.1 hypothetical protein FAZ21_08790 [Chitiniphilus eburneus]